jgi:hypothetical protein
MSDGYAALIKNARDIPVLSADTDNSVTSESTFPTKEHPSLITHTGKTVNTPLNSTLSARHIRLPTNPKDPHYVDRNTLASIKKSALTLSFRAQGWQGSKNRMGPVLLAPVTIGARAPKSYACTKQGDE